MELSKRERGYFFCSMRSLSMYERELSKEGSKEASELTEGSPKEASKDSSDDKVEFLALSLTEDSPEYVIRTMSTAKLIIGE